MSSDDKKRFKRFIHLRPLIFSRAIGEDTYEFLVDSRIKYIFIDPLSLIELLIVHNS